MADYTLEEKDSFTVLGIGTELKSDYTDLCWHKQGKGRLLAGCQTRWKA